MNPIKYIKIEDNEYDYDTMTLVNIVSHKDSILYYFIVEYIADFKGKSHITKDLLEVPEEDYNEIISLYYKIV